jgi:hypothetical protein
VILSRQMLQFLSIGVERIHHFFVKHFKPHLWPRCWC